ncbi:hypothetical protein ACKA04_04575 [Helcococcus kunzii]|uniref:hypothetical protein n=1 Tax=Helcococcus kunzii TaxID=40091 RepID=UPI00389C1D80
MVARYKIDVEKILKIKEEQGLMLKDIYEELDICDGSFQRYMKLGYTSTHKHYEKIRMWILKNEIALYMENKISFYGEGN